MSTIKSFVLFYFKGERPGEVIPLEVPKGSILLDVRALHDGIYVWYAVPEIETTSVTERFSVITGNTPIPEGAKFISIIDIFSQTPEGKDVAFIFPIFKLV